MIQKFDKLKNFGIFNFTWNEANLPLFKKYNAIYGWNCTGKTTLSRIFSVLEFGENKYLDLEDNSTAVIKTASSRLTITKEKIPTKKDYIKVFNEDFTYENLKWDEAKASPILLIGKTKIHQKKELDIVRKLKKNLEKTQEQLLSNLEEVNKEKDKLLEKIRKTIKKELSFVDDVKPKSNKASLYQNYTINDTEIILQHLKEKPYAPLNNSIEIIKAALVEKEKKDLLDDFVINMDWLDKLLLISKKIFNTTLKQRIKSTISNEVKSNVALSSWLEKGLELHKVKKNNTTCRFCKNNITSLRLEKLSQYFDETRKQLMKEIIKALEIVEINERKILIPDNKEKFYRQYESSIAKARENFFLAKQNFRKELEELKLNLINKKKNPFKKIKYNFINIKKYKKDLIIAVKGINSIIKQNNNKTNSFLSKRIEAAHRMEINLINRFKSEYGNIIKRFEKINEKLNNSNKDIEGFNKTEVALEQSLRDHGIGAKEFNLGLKAFLGRGELFFKAVDQGYSIMRNNKQANHISEGEKSAIALIFFLTTLKEDGFNPTNGIIVIDDPVSSFDSQYLYQAFGFIKARLKKIKPKQTFILTHNFPFFRQIRNWLQYEDSQLYMVKSKVTDNDKRFSVLEKIDPLLEKHDSEYGYLFKLVYHRSQSQDDNLEEDYIFPNVLRKLLENYLSFKVPISGIRIYKKFNKLLDDNQNYRISTASRNRIESYCQDQSHPIYQDSPSDFDERLIGELQPACKAIIELIKETDINHYSHLISQC